MSETEITIVSPVTLEQKLFGSDLASFVAMLSSYRGVGTRSLDEAIGARLPDVLQDGLRVLGQREIRQLLDNPACLFELQESVYCDGGDYWSRYLGEREEHETTNSSGIAPSTGDAVQTRSQNDRRFSDAEFAGGDGDRTRPTSWFRRHAFEMIAAAVMLVIGFSVAPLINPSSPTNQVSVVAFASPQSFEQLQPETWAEHIGAGMTSLQIAKTQLSEQRLSQRLAQCVEACSLIYQNDLAFVPEAHRDSLREKCRVWMQRFSDLAVSDEDLQTRAGRLNGVLLDIRDAVKKMNVTEVGDV